MLNDKSETELRHDVRNFCQRYGAINEIAQRAQLAVNRFAAPDFSVFNLFGYNEMVLSKIIADLLSPHGTHGQGPLFLEMFIRCLNDELLSGHPLDIASLEKTTVATEVATSHIIRSQRRIDILLANPPHWALGIENKPWTWEQEDQLKDYQEELDIRYDGQTQRRHIIYISGNCSKSETAASGQNPLYFGYNGNEQHCGKDHAHLVDWLIECARQCQADKVRHFLLDFVQWVRREFINQLDNSEVKGEQYGSNRN